MHYGLKYVYGDCCGMAGAKSVEAEHTVRWHGMQDDSSPESVAQNVLAIALALLLCAAVGNVVWKIVVVSWALVSAAVRYVAVALILLSIAVFLA